MNILIIEDEKLAADRLMRMIVEWLPDAQMFGPLVGVQEAVAWLSANTSPDLVMLDVQLSDGTAFDLLDRFAIACPIIFTTAFEEFAFKAHKVNSIDYLLKPIKQGDLLAALAKHQKLKEHFQSPESKKAVQAGQQYKSRFMIRLGDHLHSVPIDDISYFHVANRCTMLKTQRGQQFPLDQNMDSVEQVLPPQKFFRINRGCIISHAAIAEMRAYSKGRVLVSLAPGEEEPQVVSAERSLGFKQWLDGE